MNVALVVYKNWDGVETLGLMEVPDDKTLDEWMKPWSSHRLLGIAKAVSQNGEYWAELNPVIPPSTALRVDKSEALRLPL